MQKKSWVIVANSSMARVFKVDEKRRLSEIEALIHPESHLMGHDLVSDKSGMQSDHVGMGRHGVGDPEAPKLKEADKFAHFLSDRMYREHNEGQVDQFYIAAAPRFLGLLKQCMHSTNLVHTIKHAIDKDITHKAPNEIQEYFFPF